MELSTIRVVLARVVPTHDTPLTSAAGPLVKNLIRTHAEPSDGLEHLTVRPEGSGLDLYFFVRSASEAASFAQVQALLDRVGGPGGPLAEHGYAPLRG
ncbi:hypothetical protein [Kitasatospora sp. NPDC101183]|uniref:hypothetical protein n=1 Tax=Kitasatospora sp. NPDC101183 TaxID=3364100 RepID=UPI00381FC1FB